MALNIRKFLTSGRRLLLKPANQAEARFSRLQLTDLSNMFVSELLPLTRDCNLIVEIFLAFITDLAGWPKQFFAIRQIMLVEV